MLSNRRIKVVKVIKRSISSRLRLLLLKKNVSLRDLWKVLNNPNDLNYCVQGRGAGGNPTASSKMVTSRWGLNYKHIKL